MRDLGAFRVGRFAETRARATIAGVDFDLLASFRVFQSDQADIGHHFFTFVVDSDGGNLTEVTRGRGEQNIMPQWSSDGGTIYYYRNRPELSFRRIPSAGGESAELVAGWDLSTQNGAQVDAEGRRIIYSTLDRGEVAATMVRDIATGREAPFAFVVVLPRWSHDGRFVVGTASASSKRPMGDVTVCPVEGGPCRRVATGFGQCWSGDDSRVYFLRAGSFADGRELWSVSREGGDERHVIDLRPTRARGRYCDVSPKGEVAWVEYTAGRQELWTMNLGAL